MAGEVRTEVRGAVLEVVLDRPPVNAIDLATSRALYEAFKRLNDDDDLRVGIIAAAENARSIFSAGWDLKAIARGDGRSETEGFDVGPGGIGGLPEFWDLYKPVIAAIGGRCVGGGFEMALGADLIVAAEDASFYLPEIQKGFLPDAGAIQKLHHRLPYNVAMDMILTEREMPAAEAKHWGLVRDLVPRAELMTTARDLAQKVARGTPLVTRALKEYRRHTAPLSPEQAHAVTRKAWVGKSGLAHYEAMLFSEDMQEGIEAFAEKRPAKLKGN